MVYRTLNPLSLARGLERYGYVIRGSSTGPDGHISEIHLSMQAEGPITTTIERGVGPEKVYFFNLHGGLSALLAKKDELVAQGIPLIEDITEQSYGDTTITFRDFEGFVTMLSVPTPKKADAVDGIRFEEHDRDALVQQASERGRPEGSPPRSIDQALYDELEKQFAVPSE